VDRFLRTRTTRLVRDPSASWFVRGDAGDSGVACWRILDWDSQQFGMKAARIEHLEARGDYASALKAKLSMLDQMLGECRNASICHLSARVESGDLSAVHALEARGFQLLDGIQTFSLLLSGEPAASNTPFEIRLASAADLPDVLRIARTAYVFDRFHGDSALSTETADRIHEQWVRNSVEGRTADAVIVACQRSRPVAYVTCKVDWDTRGIPGAMVGTIVLVATDAAHRGKGAARAATLGALDWFRNHSVDIVEVGTQLRNIPAGRLYENLGFRLAGTSLTFRLLL
jgi:dTDP-4-amino-4,6-dideoxy-D-galactose acyltransferase